MSGEAAKLLGECDSLFCEFDEYQLQEAEYFVKKIKAAREADVIYSLRQLITYFSSSRSPRAFRDTFPSSMIPRPGDELCPVSLDPLDDALFVGFAMNLSPQNAQLLSTVAESSFTPVFERLNTFAAKNGVGSFSQCLGVPPYGERISGAILGARAQTMASVNIRVKFDKLISYCITTMRFKFSGQVTSNRLVLITDDVTISDPEILARHLRTLASFRIDLHVIHVASGSDEDERIKGIAFFYDNWIQNQTLWYSKVSLEDFRRAPSCVAKAISAELALLPPIRVRELFGESAIGQ